MVPHLLPGDVFGVRSPGVLGKGIRFVEWVQSPDWEATYNHSGIILDEQGRTFEALWRIREASLKEYEGRQVIIARYLGRTERRVEMALAAIRAKYAGRGYPFWRIGLYLIPYMAKFASTGKYGVCSEVTAEYLYFLGARHKHWPGANPDMLADEWRRWQVYEVIFEGRLEVSRQG